MGKKNYKQAYSKYKPNVDFTAYVDHYPDLQNAWAMIEARITGADMSQLPQHNPNLTNEQSADYWIKRMPVGNINDLAAAKKAFGQAHAAEDNALMIGKYMGATDYDVGSADWQKLFSDYGSTPGDPNTRYQDYLRSSTAADDDDDDNGDDNGDDNDTGQDLTNPRTHPWVDTVLKENLSFNAQDWSRFMTKPGTGQWNSGIDLGENKGLMFQRYTPEFTATYGGATPFQYLKTPYKKPKGERWKAPPHIEGSGSKKKKSTTTG